MCNDINIYKILKLSQLFVKCIIIDNNFKLIKNNCIDIIRDVDQNLFRSWFVFNYESFLICHFLE